MLNGLQIIAEAANGKDALRLAQKEKPDVILLDVMMPIMNGLEMLKELRQVSDIPVIIVSANGNQDIVDEARQVLGLAG